MRNIPSWKGTRSSPQNKSSLGQHQKSQKYVMLLSWHDTTMERVLGETVYLGKRANPFCAGVTNWCQLRWLFFF